MTWVLDASAAICWLTDEPGAERMEEILAGDEPIVIHAVNLLEVQYNLLRVGEKEWQAANQILRTTRIEVVRDMDDDLLARAARLKAHQAPIALGDVFAVALAQRQVATLLTTDRSELQKIADAGICQIEFLR